MTAKQASSVIHMKHGLHLHVSVARLLLGYSKSEFVIENDTDKMQSACLKNS